MKKEINKQPQPNEPISKGHYAFCYTLGSTNILIHDDIDVEILRISTIYKVPHVPKWYTGTTSLRGAILPVVNMHFLLAINHQETSQVSRKVSANSKSSKTKQTLLRLKHPDFPALVIIIDGLPYQTDISELSTHMTANTITNTLPNQTIYPHWVTSSAHYKNKLYLFADYACLFSALQNSDQSQLVVPDALTSPNQLT